MVLQIRLCSFLDPRNTLTRATSIATRGVEPVLQPTERSCAGTDHPGED